MTIEEERVIDFIGVSKESGTRILTISDHLEWADYESHSMALQSKINFYLGGVTTEEIKNRSGLGRAGFYYIINEILKAGYDTMLLTLRLKGNLAHALPGRLSPVPQCEYALYQVKL